MPVHRIPLAALALAAVLVLPFGRSHSGPPRARALDADAPAVQQTTASQPLSAASWQFTSLNLPSAWQATNGTNPSAAVVAVVDSGVTAGAFGLQGRVLPGYDFVNSDADATDDNGHGTMIGDIIASTCPTCKILPVKVLGADHTGDWPTIAQGITWAADHGADVINLSVGAPRAPENVAAATAYAVAKGVIVVAAAGNDGRDESFYPAMYAGVVSVAGVDQNASRYDWSNYGSWVTVEAPGCAPTNGAADFCGTSAAAPFISGIAGLARSVDRNLTPDAFTAELRATSPAPVDASTASAGLPDANRLLAAFGPPPTLLARPSAFGRPRVGSRLSAGAGRWQSAVSYTLQWQRSLDGKTWQSVATGPSYLLGRSDAGYTFRVLVTARNVHGSTASASAVTRRVAPAAHRARPHA